MLLIKSYSFNPFLLLSVLFLIYAIGQLIPLSISRGKNQCYSRVKKDINDMWNAGTILCHGTFTVTREAAGKAPWDRTASCWHRWGGRQLSWGFAEFMTLIYGPDWDYTTLTSTRKFKKCLLGLSGEIRHIFILSSQAPSLQQMSRMHQHTWYVKATSLQSLLQVKHIKG